MGIVLILVVIAIVWVLVAENRGAGPGVFTHGQTGAAADPVTGENPRDILDKRYARGEIGKAEYEERRRGLEV